MPITLVNARWSLNAFGLTVRVSVLPRQLWAMPQAVSHSQLQMVVIGAGIREYDCWLGWTDQIDEVVQGQVLVLCDCAIAFFKAIIAN